MTMKSITKACLDERERLLDTYLASLPTGEVINREQIAELIDQIEQEYKSFLKNLWHSIRNKDQRKLDDLLDKRYNRFGIGSEYGVSIKSAISEAEEITLWEQITNSNYRDIEHLNALIRAYARDLLAHITLDFMEDIK